MKPQIQTILGTGKDGEPRGNCFATCIASILELPVDSLPNFCETDDWRERANEWLAELGYFYLDVIIPEDMRAELIFQFAGYHVISGVGPRGCRHSVVGLSGKMVHDPHPSGDGLTSEDQYGFLIPFNPVV
jgi:hypothetical protein